MKFYRCAQIAATQVSCVALATLYVLGDKYLTTGYGLHPVLCGMLMMFLLVWPYFLTINEE